MASFPDAVIEDPVVARTLESFVRAWQTRGIEGLIATLRQDVRPTMLPVPSWSAGGGDVVNMISDSVLPAGRFRLLPAYFNAQPSFTLVLNLPMECGEELGQMDLGVDVSGISATDVVRRL